MKKHLFIALAQLRSQLYQKEINLHRIITAIKNAHQKNADIIIFPELYLTGYSINEKAAEMAEPLKGYTVTRIQEAAKEFQINVVVGLPEKAGDYIYNSAVFINEKGEIVGVYRKIHLFSHEKEIFTPGEHIPVFNLPQGKGKIGFAIQYDLEFPELSRTLALKGAEIIFVLSSNMVPYQTHQSTFLLARALENQIFVAGVNRVGLEEDTIFFGESSVVSPTGEILYKSLNNEDLFLVQVDLDKTSSSKGVLNYLENRRESVYQREGLL